MKKLLTSILGAAVICSSALGFTACGGNNKSNGLSVYMPDGAPALAMASLMSVEANFGKDVSYHVVDATEIASHVTYNDMSKNADICVLPVNDASKLLGDGAKYQMLGTVTHGNLYIVSQTDKTEITSENFAEKFSGAKVGVFQMAKFPGAVTQLIVNDYGITDAKLIGETPQTYAASDCDYFIMPEPAASTQVGANSKLEIVGSLQEIYGDGNGYPQAVLVAKKSLIKSNPEFIAQFTKSLVWSAEWLLNDEVSATDIFNAIKAHYPDPEGTAPSFQIAQLTKEVIENCSVYFEKAEDCKEEVQEFLTKLGAKPASDNFFYI